MIPIARRASSYAQTTFGALALAASTSYGIAAIPDMPKEFADAPAVVLEDTTTWTVAANGDSKRSIHVRILLLKREGFSEADRTVTYRTDDSEIRAFKARTIRADGTAVEIPPDLRQDTVYFKDAKHEVRILQFTFPGVEAGAIIEWEYEFVYTGSRRWTWWYFQRHIPVLHARFLTRALPPAKEDLVLNHYERVASSKWCSDLPSSLEGKYEVRETVCKDVPAFEEETHSPPDVDVEGGILMTWDHGKWASLSEKAWWGLNTGAWERITKFTKPRAKVKALADKLSPPGTPAPEVVNRVYAWVKKNLKIREEGVSGGLGTAKGEAETIEQVLERGGGRADDVTLLTWALLLESSITAHPVLVADRSEEKFVFEIPDWDQADHMMLQVQTGNSTGYLDPSCRFCQVGVPDWRYCGGPKSGIRIDGQRVPWTVDVPAVSGEYNSERRTDRVVLNEDGAGRVEGTVVWSGQYEVAWREDNGDLSEAARRDEFLKTVGGDIEDATVTIPDPEAIDENVTIGYRYTRGSMASQVGNRLLVRPPDFFSRLLWLPLQEDRKFPVWWRYARSARAEVTLVLPEGFEAPSLPSSQALEGPGMRFGEKWSRGSTDREIVWTGLLLVQRTTLDIGDYPKAREFDASLRRTLAAGVVVMKGMQSLPGGEPR